MSKSEQEPVQPEKPETLLDIADPQLQGSLIERFFTKKYPDMPLSDPAARKLAMHEWVGDMDDKTTLAARFRAYVESVQKESPDGHTINSTDPAELDRILDELNRESETLH